MNNKVKLGFIVIGISTLLGNSFVLYYVWISAFLKGGFTVISINSCNEMWPEFFFIPITIIIAIWTLYQLMFKVTIKKRIKQ